MTHEIRIDDLAEPVLSDLQRSALAYGKSQHTDLTVDAVLDRARGATGLDDFGPDDFHERLGLWLSEMNEDPDAVGLARLVLFGNAVRYASNRLRMADLLRRHPEIHDVPIERPVIVVGLPRSGTTNLVNLLGADQRFRSMSLWESYEPVPDPAEAAGADGVDPRWTRCNGMWEAMRATVPYVAAMHPMEPDHIHEEIELQLSDFASYNQEWVSRAPKWRDYHLSHDQTPHYRYMKTALQVPDATFVVTHRDPVAVVQSTATMMAYSARMAYRHTVPEWYVEYWTDRIRRLLESSVRDRHLFPADRTVDVYFDRYMADEMGTLQHIYDVAGLDFTPEARRQIGAHRDAHPRGKEGRVVYDLRRDFSVTPDEVRTPFDFYFDRFDTRIEVT
jgi:hypothetical protein